MKQKYFNLILFILALLSGVGTFTLKHYVREKEKNLRQIYGEIIKNKRELHGLKTDWAALTNPEQLRLQAKQTQAKPIRAGQIVQIQQLTERPMPLPGKKPHFEGENDVL